MGWIMILYKFTISGELLQVRHFSIVIYIPTFVTPFPTWKNTLVNQRFPDNFNVPAKMHVLYVFQIILNALFHFPQFACFSMITIHLSPACNSWPYLVPFHVPIHQLRIHLSMFQHVRLGVHTFNAKSFIIPIA